jgi:predicted Zn finger-like uncharacterized protein
MRLICPNCDAQYEVPEDVMPREGRDVQCSNCGQTWFQDHPDTIAERETAGAEDEAHEDEEVVRIEEPAPKTSEQEPAAESNPLAGVPTHEPGRYDDHGRRRLDPAVADVLREEAELETRARRSEAAAMESQPDLGLAESPGENRKRAREARERMARIRGEKDPGEARDDEVPMGTTLGSRRDLLPDIEEINSTLRSNSERSPDLDPGQTAQIEMQEKRSSRRGFILTLALVAMLALLYAYAPQLAEAVPQAEPWLSGYVATIDGWRLWLDDEVSALLTWLDAAAESSRQ